MKRCVRDFFIGFGAMLTIGTVLHAHSGSQQCVNCNTGHSIWCHDGLFGQSCAEFDALGHEIGNVGINPAPACDNWGNVRDWAACDQIRVD